MIELSKPDLGKASCEDTTLKCQQGGQHRLLLTERLPPKGGSGGGVRDVYVLGVMGLSYFNRGRGATVLGLATFHKALA